MNLKLGIVENVKAGKSDLKDIYASFPSAKKESIRGILNLLTKEGSLIRVGRGQYAFKKDEASNL